LPFIRKTNPIRGLTGGEQDVQNGLAIRAISPGKNNIGGESWDDWEK
jgi:hypothetical protein